MRSNYCDFKDGKIVMDNHTEVANDGATHKGYFQAITYDKSASKVYELPGDYVVAYDRTNRILDFSGTYNGLPVLVGVVAKNINTGNIDGVFTQMYANLKLQLTPASQSSISSGASTMKAETFSHSKSISAESFKNFRLIK